MLAMHCNLEILDCRHHLASWGPIMRKVPTHSGQWSTGFLSPATRCSAGSSATSSTSCCETDTQTYVKTTQRFPLAHQSASVILCRDRLENLLVFSLVFVTFAVNFSMVMLMLLGLSSVAPSGDKGLHEEQG